MSDTLYYRHDHVAADPLDDPRVAIAHHSSQTVVPIEGATINLAAGGLHTSVSLEPAGNLTALTFTATDGTADGQVITVVSRKLVAGVTFSGANIDAVTATQITTLSSANVGGDFSLAWFAAAGKWKAIHAI